MSQQSVWAYPWDLHDRGLDAALQIFVDCDVNTISLATSYHAGKFLSPGNPKRRVYFPQDGTVYYTVEPERWKNSEIKPLQAEIVASEGDYLAKLTRLRDAGGPKVSCWTVCMHNFRLGLAHPEHVLRTAHGDRLSYGLCPSSPAARAYVTGIVNEISERYRPDRIELESPDFMEFDHGFHHEKDGLGLLPEDLFLLGVCFCAHCQKRAKSNGVDADAAQEAARRLLDQSFERETPETQFPDFPATKVNAFSEFPDLFDYLIWRSEPITSLIREIREAAHADSSILLIDDINSWWRGVDLSAAARHCDGVVYCSYTTSQDQILPNLENVRRVIGPNKTLIVGFQLFYPEVSDRTDFAARMEAALQVADGCNYYNFGLVPNARMSWLSRNYSEAYD